MSADATTRLPAAVHVDLDGAADVFRVHGWRWPAGAGDALFDRGVPALLDFLDANGVRATLFAVAGALDDRARRARLLDAVARGHEIASHSISHRPLPGLPDDQRRREIGGSRAKLEDALGVRVRGFRAPDFAIDARTLEQVAEAGYAFDSSLHAGARAPRGGGAVPAEPHRPLAGSSLVELPMPRAGLPLPFHPSYSLVLGDAWFRLGLRRAQGAGAPLILLFHLTDVGPPLPRQLVRRLRERFFTLSYLSQETKQRRCARMVARTRGAFVLADTEALLSRVGDAG